jgi:regulator of sigma E protease
LSWLWEYVLPFVAVLGSVVLFHEFGHYLVAKWLGITVEVFSVGFGPRVTGFVRGGTDYRLSWIPLGGYVKLKGESPEEGAAVPDPGDLLSRPRWQRFLVFVMGAVFNLVTALVLTAAILMHGVNEVAYLDQPPVVGGVDREVAASGADVLPGDRVVSIGGQPVSTWKDLDVQMLLSPGQRREIILERGGRRLSTRIAIPVGPRGTGLPVLYARTDVLVGGLQPGWPAEKAGLEPGDRIVAIDGVPMTTLRMVYDTIQAAPERPLRLTIERAGATLERTVVPVSEGGRGKIGFVPVPPTVVRSYPLLAALARSVGRNIDDTRMVFDAFRRLLTRELSLRSTFSGPIELFLFSGAAAQEGLVPFLHLIAFVSLQLGIINLFPIPPLDGGHIATLLIEGAIRRELSARFKERVMQAGLILLLVFMGTIIYFDISKTFFR